MLPSFRAVQQGPVQELGLYLTVAAAESQPPPSRVPFIAAAILLAKLHQFFFAHVRDVEVISLDIDWSHVVLLCCMASK
jgi:hypothetical protein